ncbi:hypothetical protein, partial [Methylobacterium sp. WSM2598]|uniref:hypothetical protein n=1 Tax=Methylobacterium sp. WSM2598 TaxID=398261 RepID=UPI000563F4C3
MALDEIKDLLAGAEEPVFVADRRPAEEDADNDELDDVEVDSLETEFREALDLTKWTSGERMDQLAVRLEREVEAAAKHEDNMAPRVLRALEEGLKTAPDRSREIGVYLGFKRSSQHHLARQPAQRRAPLPASSSSASCAVC